MEEIWKGIPNYEGFMASNLGRIKRLATKTINKNGFYRKLPEKILTNNNNGAGYFSVMMSVSGRKPFRRYVHRLVAMAFLDMDESMQVDHINFDKSNNRVENLRVVTQRENNHFYQKTRVGKKTCKYIGVTYSKEKDLYFPIFSLKNVNYNLGSYKTAEEAKKVYDKALKEWLDKGKLPYNKRKNVKKEGQIKNIFSRNGKYTIIKGYKYKNYRIGSYENKEDAIQCLEEFNKFVECNKDMCFIKAVEEFKRLYNK